MLRFIYLLLLLALLPVPSAEAAIVSFMGHITSGNGTELGNVPPVSEFGLQLNFTPTSSDVATINSGRFRSGVVDAPVVGGEILLFNGGRVANFVINTDAPSGTITTSFFGASTADLTSEGLVSLINESAPTTISVAFDSGSTYTGRVESAAIPEPSSGALICIFAGFASLGRRRREPKTRRAPS